MPSPSERGRRAFRLLLPDAIRRERDLYRLRRAGPDGRQVARAIRDRDAPLPSFAIPDGGGGLTARLDGNGRNRR